MKKTATKPATLKSLEPIAFQPIWAEYEKWDWEQQSEWALTHAKSDCLRRAYIIEQMEFAKEARIGKATAQAMEPMLRRLVKDALLEFLGGAADEMTDDVVDEVTNDGSLF